MSCTKNPKRFLLWKYNGDHDYKIVRFGRFIHGSNHYIVLFECKHCGCQYKQNFVSEASLIERGVDIETVIFHRDKLF
jgi:hypothetical protein